MIFLVLRLIQIFLNIELTYFFQIWQKERNRKKKYVYSIYYSFYVILFEYHLLWYSKFKI